MTFLIWLALCFFLAALSFVLLFFRKRLAFWLAAHPRITRALALSLAAFMVALSLIPIVIIVYHTIG